jgi:tetratricopeptide (TPR) repeat protein
MLSAENDEQLAEYTKRTREEIRSSNSFLSLLKLMNELKQYNSIDRFAEMFRDDYSSLDTNPGVLDAIHNIFGLIYLDRGQLKEALEHFHKSLNICLDSLSSADHPKLAVTYNNIGCVHLTQSNYETALTFYQSSRELQ